VGLVPEHPSKIEARRDEADLIAYPVRNVGGLRVVEDDALLAIDPARLEVDASDDGIDAEHGDLVHEDLLLCIEDLALPGEDVNELCDLGREDGARREDCRPLPLAVRNGAGFGAREDGAELGLGHGEQLCDIVGHCGSLCSIMRALNRKEDWTIGSEDEVIDDGVLRVLLDPQTRGLLYQSVFVIYWLTRSGPLHTACE
jgi:hypothetical protein